MCLQTEPTKGANTFGSSTDLSTIVDKSFFDQTLDLFYHILNTRSISNEREKYFLLKK